MIALALAAETHDSRRPPPAAAQRAGRALVSAVLRASLDAVVAIDAAGRIVEFNPAAERCFGYAAEDALGRDMAELLVPPALRDRHRAGLARHMAGGPAVVSGRRIEITAQRAGGEQFPVELTITRVALDGDALFVAYIRDIGERRRTDAELRASRARIVAAGDAARRRIERDLHDGAQQHLVAVAATLHLVRARIDGDAASARGHLDAAIDALAIATAELRELARGIHPAVLTEGGLAPALAGLAGRAPLPVAIGDAPAQRLPAAVEATAYFVVAEALTNTVRHAGATRAAVRFEVNDAALVVQVDDDGRGGATAGGGAGLAGLADRVTALGGTLAVDSPAGRGTIVRAELPCAS
jgi:PAS domain S-box-containing protein